MLFSYPKAGGCPHRTTAPPLTVLTDHSNFSITTELLAMGIHCYLKSHKNGNSISLCGVKASVQAATTGRKHGRVVCRVLI
jgi:hypothetical protein